MRLKVHIMCLPGYGKIPFKRKEVDLLNNFLYRIIDDRVEKSPTESSKKILTDKFVTRISSTYFAGCTSANDLKVTTMIPPEQWPAAVKEEFDAIRVLGKGGFASVVLAKRKETLKGQDEHVAIKVVGSKEATDFEVGYAHREVHILNELSHPCIMKLLDHWEPPKKDNLCVAVLALSYARGNTLELLLNKGGAPGLPFCRVVMAQLVDTLAYLHSHAVIHRDIKPDNIIVKSASTTQQMVWEDNISGDPGWETLRAKWHITLVDFGFARALSKDDIEGDVGLFNAVKGNVVQSHNPVEIAEALDMSQTLNGSGHSKRRGSTSKSTRSLDRSFSRKIVRDLSSLGNRSYAAPEIIKGAHDLSDSKRKKATKTISSVVSDYGMVADAYSLGATIRYTLSGVPPHENIDEVIRKDKGIAGKFGRFLQKKKDKKNKGKEEQAAFKRKKAYRPTSEFPSEASKLISGLTHWKPASRTTIRMARGYHYIDDVLENAGEWYATKEVKYLECA